MWPLRTEGKYLAMPSFSVDTPPSSTAVFQSTAIIITSTADFKLRLPAHRFHSILRPIHTLRTTSPSMVVSTKPLRIFIGCLKAQRHWEMGGEGRFTSNCLQSLFPSIVSVRSWEALLFFWEMPSVHSLKKRECPCHLLQRFSNTGGDWRTTRRGDRSSSGCFRGKLFKKGAVPETSVVLSWLEARNSSVFGAYCLGLLSFFLWHSREYCCLEAMCAAVTKPGAQEYLVGRTTGLTRSPPPHPVPQPTPQSRKTLNAR